MIGLINVLRGELSLWGPPAQILPRADTGFRVNTPSTRAADLTGRLKCDHSPVPYEPPPRLFSRQAANTTAPLDCNSPLHYRPPGLSSTLREVRQLGRETRLIGSSE
jgi:hypothetical protein